MSQNVTAIINFVNVEQSVYFIRAYNDCLCSKGNVLCVFIAIDDWDGRYSNDETDPN